MATVNKDIADKLIANNGLYEDDTPVIKIVEYDNAWGGKSYGIIYQGESPDRYRASEYVMNPRTLWERK